MAESLERNLTLPRRRRSLRDRLTGSLRGSLSWRRYSSGDSPVGLSWLHEDHVLKHESVTFKVKYLGSQDSPSAKGPDIILQAIAALKKTGSPLHPWLMLHVSQENLTLMDETDPKEAVLVFEFATHRISSVSEFKKNDVYVGIIIRHGRLGQHKVHVFQTNHQSQEVALTLGQAFQLAFSRYMKTQEEDGAAPPRQAVGNADTGQRTIQQQAETAVEIHNIHISSSTDTGSSTVLAGHTPPAALESDLADAGSRPSPTSPADTKDCWLGDQDDDEMPLLSSPQAVAEDRQVPLTVAEAPEGSETVAVELATIAVDSAGGAEKEAEEACNQRYRTTAEPGELDPGGAPSQCSDTAALDSAESSGATTSFEALQDKSPNLPSERGEVQQEMRFNDLTELSEGGDDGEVMPIAASSPDSNTPGPENHSSLPRTDLINLQDKQLNCTDEGHETKLSGQDMLLPVTSVPGQPVGNDSSEAQAGKEHPVHDEFVDVSAQDSEELQFEESDEDEEAARSSRSASYKIYPSQHLDDDDDDDNDGDIVVTLHGPGYPSHSERRDEAEVEEEYEEEEEGEEEDADENLSSSSDAISAGESTQALEISNVIRDNVPLLPAVLEQLASSSSAS